MTPNEQADILSVLGEVWSLSPEVRLGQLMAHLGFLGEAHLEQGLGTIEDDELLAILYRHRAELVARLQGTDDPDQPRGDVALSISGSPMPRDATEAVRQEVGR
jgi:hypothetical protein